MSSITRYPTSNSVGTTGWTNPANAYADDGVYATAAPVKSATISSYFGGFDFSSIGDNDTINSVTLYCKYHIDTQASIADIALRTYDNTTQIGTTDLTNATEPLTDTEFSQVITPTIAQLKSATFRIRASAHRGNSNTAVTFSLDHIRVVVDFTPASAGVTGTIVQTLEDASISASGKVEVKGTLVATLQDATIVALASSGNMPITASIMQELESATIFATGRVAVKGEVNAILESCGVVATGHVMVNGAINQSLENAEIVAIGKAMVNGAINQALENAGVVATGKVPITARVIITLDSATINASGQVITHTNKPIRHSAIGLFGINGGLGQLRTQ